VRLTTVAVVLCGVLAMAAPSPAAAGSISGTVTAEGGGSIEGVEVCPTPQPYTFETSCVETGPSGQYKLDGLPGSDYIIRFSADRANLRYVSEFYNDKAYSWEADLFNLGPAEDRGLNVALAEGGSISGAVTDETTAQPIADVRACAIDQQGIPRRCSDTGTNGEYQLNGLPGGVYNIEYEGGSRVNYLREFFEDAETWAAATDVTVTAPATTPDIDAELSPGAQILGHVSTVGTGVPRERVFVCADEVDPGEYQGCDLTDSNGDYAIRSLPAGTYLVAFELEYMPFGLIAGQWWQGAATMAEATPIAIAPPETRTGIDGRLPELFPKPKPKPIQVSLIPRTSLPDALKKCKKGFHKKWVKGTKRCVRKHKLLRKNRHRGGKR
jgi:hypothetical protein